MSHSLSRPTPLTSAATPGYNDNGCVSVQVTVGGRRIPAWEV